MGTEPQPEPEPGVGKGLWLRLPQSLCPPDAEHRARFNARFHLEMAEGKHGDVRDGVSSQLSRRRIADLSLRDIHAMYISQ